MVFLRFIARGPSPLDVTSIRIFESDARKKCSRGENKYVCASDFSLDSRAETCYNFGASGPAHNGHSAHYSMRAWPLSIGKIHDRQKKK